MCIRDSNDLELSKAHHFSFWYKNVLNEIRLKSEIYYQSLYDIPIASAENSFSAINIFEEVNSLQLVSNGTGRNYGVEISAQKYFTKNSFWLANLSLYE